MAGAIDKIAQLVPFAAAGFATVQRIEVRVRDTARDAVKLFFELQGVIAALRIPTPSIARRADRLWEHTCCEAFLRVDGEPSYYEFNFSPSGEWAAYRFRDYRDGGALEAPALAPQIDCRCAPDRLELVATIHLDRLAGISPGARLRVGLSAVIESSGGELSYWALKHPAAKPDFHHAESFALELGLPGQGGGKRIE